MSQADSQSTTPECAPPSTVIDAADRFGSAPRLAREWTIEKIRAVHAPSVVALPFVTRKEHETQLAQPLCFWNDVPSGDHCSDFHRGKVFAEMTIEAIARDKCGSRPLERIFEAIIKDAVVRRARGGKHSRQMPPAVDGFLCRLSKELTGPSFLSPVAS